MIRFLTPVRGAVQSDINTRVKLLDSAPAQLKTGFELILLEDDFTKEELISKNIRALPYSVCSVHTPFPQIDGDHASYQLTSKTGQTMLRAAAAIAQSNNVPKVVVHSQLAYTFNEWQVEFNQEQWRDDLFDKIFSIIKKIESEYEGIQLCLENMPLPLFADSVINGDMMRYNPCILTFGDLKRAQAAGVNITFDLCHYEIMRTMWHHWLKRDGCIDQEKIQQEDHIVGVYMDDKQPDFLTVVEKMGKIVEHLHLADSKGLWQNNNSLPGGGLALGEGQIDRTELLKLLQYIEKSDKEYTINLEIRDENLSVLEQTKSSLLYLAENLYGKQT